MKRYIILLSLVTIFTSVSSYSQTLTAKDLVGKWEGTDESNDKGSLEFVDSATLVLSMMGKTIPARYTVDFSKTPAHFNIIIGPGGNQTTLQCLIQLTDADNLKWQVFPGGNRPKDFDKNDSETLIVLKRKK